MTAMIATESSLQPHLIQFLERFSVGSFSSVLAAMAGGVIANQLHGLVEKRREKWRDSAKQSVIIIPESPDSGKFREVVGKLVEIVGNVDMPAEVVHDEEGRK